jgi:hypothetical protein
VSCQVDFHSTTLQRCPLWLFLEKRFGDQSAWGQGPNIILSDGIRARCSTLGRRLIEDNGFAAKLFSASLRKVRRDTGPLWVGDELGGARTS